MSIEEEFAVTEVDNDIPEKVPKMLMFRVAVMPVAPKTVSTGGIAIPNQSRINQAYLECRGRVVAVGPFAFKKKYPQSGEPLWPEECRPKVGDFVVYGTYAGQKIEYGDRKLLILNDDEILCVIDDPDLIRIYL